MNLLLLSIEFPPGPGGIGAHAYQLAHHLTRHSWRVTVASPQRFEEASIIKEFNRQQPFEVLSLQYKGPFLIEGLYRLWKVSGEARRNRPSVIAAFGRQAAWLGAAVSFLTGVPLVVTGAGTEFTVRGRFDRWLTRCAYWRAELATVNSRFTWELAARQGFPVGRMRVIPPGADDTQYRPDLPTEVLRARLGLGGRRVILTVGQVSERKAQDIVIKALPQVLKSCPEAVYLMVGIPTRQKELERLAGELGVANRVVFMGAVPQKELPFIYNLAEVLVLVSRRTTQGDVEGFGIVAVEAALCGIPAVVSADSGLVEAVVPGETALVVPPEDPAATAQAILRLLQDDNLRRDMGRAAHQHASATSTWSQRLEEYQHAVEEVVAKDSR